MGGVRRWRTATAAGIGLGVAALSGCQTWVGGMTLPSPRYLEHYPQYFTPDPVFPLPRELANMTDPTGAGVGGAVPLPAPVPAPAALPGAGGGANPAPGSAPVAVPPGVGPR